MIRGAAAALAVLLLVACVRSERAGARIPRGATISVRTVDEISTEVHRVGDPFTAALSAPIREAGTRGIAVPIGSRVDGVVGAIRPRRGDSRPPRIELRLTRLYLPDGSYVDLRTAALARQAEPSGAEIVIVPKESPLVFTLEQPALIPRAR
ncbi:MAG: hypothetical protein KIT09_07170 [Bryobacteraceae bacterium]|nr:hypothetical protein [Bryobacteraceae bacterium]